MREFAINLLYYLSQADSGVARTIALQVTDCWGGDGCVGDGGECVLKVLSHRMDGGSTMVSLDLSS